MQNLKKSKTISIIKNSWKGDKKEKKKTNKFKTSFKKCIQLAIITKKTKLKEE